MSKRFFVLFVLGFCVSCAPNKDDGASEQVAAPVAPAPAEEAPESLPPPSEPPEVLPLPPAVPEVPKPPSPTPPQPKPDEKTDKTVILDHRYFKVKYDPKYRLAKYVRYELKASNLRKKAAVRSDVFKLDSKLIDFKIPPVLPQDYFGSGYDRGHLAPSADFLWDQKANDTSFVMTNIAPQASYLNSGSWLKLESSVRHWACTEDKLLVFAGPVLEQKMEKLKAGIAVPKRFFKIILDMTPPRKAIGFIFDQNDSENELNKITISPYKIGKIIKEDFREEFPKEDRYLFKEESYLSDWRETECVAH